jgi:hypothetical protein
MDEVWFEALSGWLFSDKAVQTTKPIIVMLMLPAHEYQGLYQRF